MAGKKDSQSNKYLLTINNPKEKGLSHEEIKKVLISNFRTLEYFSMADEIGQTYHTHVFICFRSRVRFSTIKKAFPEAHIDVVKGLVSENINYIKKVGKWADTDKAETSVPNTFEEYGKRPMDTKGTRSDMTELYQMVSDGLTNVEILAQNQDYILQIDKIEKLRTMLLTEKFKGTIRSNLRVIYVFGETGTGKTSGILAEHGAENVYRVTDYKHPYDLYNCENCLCMDEFRNSLYIKEMLNYCDIYPLELPARYSNKYACFETIYIVSNWELERQYEAEQENDKETWKAFLRRIHEVHEYKSIGEKIVYKSVEEYFQRNIDFKKIEDDDDILPLGGGE